MKHRFIGMLAESFIHPGAGQNEGEIDLPVARESTTGHPFIAGSSLKGAFLDKLEQSIEPSKEQLDKATEELKESNGQFNEWAEEKQKNAVYKLALSKITNPIFGKQDKSGAVMVSDARLLLLPVRSLNMVYRWVTCPYILERLTRDARRSMLGDVPEIPQVGDNDYLGSGKEGERCFFEERDLRRSGPVPSGWPCFIERFVFHPEVKTRLQGQMTFVSNRTFDWFANNSLPVQARNVLDNKTKESKNLWYEESLPCDTLMYSVLIQRRESDGDVLERLFEEIKTYPFLQTGGNETVGQGWFALQVLDEDYYNDFVGKIAEGETANA